MAPPKFNVGFHGEAAGRTHGNGFVARGKGKRAGDHDASAGSVLLLKPAFFKKAQPFAGRAVKNWQFRAVAFHQNIIDLQRRQGGHQVLDGADSIFAAAQGCRQIGAGDIFRAGGQYGGLRQVDPFEFDAAVGPCRAQPHGDVPAAVQAQAAGRYIFANGFLFDDSVHKMSR